MAPKPSKVTKASQSQKMGHTRLRSKAGLLNSQGELPTPETTPEPEEGRRKVKQLQQATESDNSSSDEDKAQAQVNEIDRIGKCSDKDEAAAEVLQLETGSSEDVATSAWVRLGCLLHPEYCRIDNAQDAFESRYRTVSG